LILQVSIRLLQWLDCGSLGRVCFTRTPLTDIIGMLAEMDRIFQTVIDRILKGEVVPVKKDFQQIISETLTDKNVVFEVVADESNTERVLFSLTKVGDN